MSVNICVLIFAMYACSSADNDESGNFKLSKGRYNFTMSDSAGKKLVSGIMNVSQIKGNEISGSYEFNNILDSSFPGFTSMEKEFAGNFSADGKEIFINTNPKIADSNVFWYFKVKSSSLSGDWVYSVFRGQAGKGKIKITR